MLNHDLNTQIFYLNRIFKIISDGYNSSYILLNPDLLNGHNSFSEVAEAKKQIIKNEDLKELLAKLFNRLYQHTKMFTNAPKIFGEAWNNEYLIKSIEETKSNINQYILNESNQIKTYYNLEKDDYQIIELQKRETNEIETLLFMTEFH